MKKLLAGTSNRTLHVILICLAYLALVIFAVAPTAYSKFTSSGSGQDSAVVAKFDVDVGVFDGDTPVLTLDLSGVSPGYTKSYKFIIHNNSEVTVRSTFSVDTLGELPLEFTAQIGSAAPTDANGYDLTLAGGDSTEVIMTVTWPSDANDPIYAGLIDLVNLSLVTEQVD